MADGDLIDPQGGDPRQVPSGLGLLDGTLVYFLDGPPVQGLKEAHRLIGHHLTELAHQSGQGRGDPGVAGHKGQDLCCDAAGGTGHPHPPKPQEGQRLPEGQVLDLLLPPVIGGGHRLVTAPTDIAGGSPFQVDDRRGTLLPDLELHPRHLKPLYAQETCEILSLHLGGPPSCSWIVPTLEQGEYTSPDAFSSLYPQYSVKSPF